MIFPVLELERVIQIGDKTRLSGVKSFSAADQIDSVLIRPESSADDFDVTPFSQRDWFLDWVYQGTSSRDVTVSITIKAGDKFEIVEKTLKVLSSADDPLFSNDQDLEALEPKLLSYVPDGRSSFLNVHREARDKILETFNDRGLTMSGGPVTALSLLNQEQVRTWSKYLTLSLIFKGMSLAPDDIFSVKGKIYEAEALSRSELAIVSLDLDGDGNPDESGPQSFQTVRVGWLSR